MEEHNLDNIYLATTPNNVNFVKLVKKYFGDRIKTFDDLEKFVRQQIYPGFLDNTYFSSFIEQELCYRGTYFLGSGLSSWTQTVLTDRLAAGNYNHGSILVRLGMDDPPPPGYPPLIFQFPEGWFKFQFPEDTVSKLMHSHDRAVGGEDESLEALNARRGQKCQVPVKDLTLIKVFGVNNRVLDEILFRYANKHQLNTAVLVKDEKVENVDFKFSFSRDMLAATASMENRINIMSEHIGYSLQYRSVTTRAMRYITMILDPIEHQKQLFMDYHEELPYTNILGDEQRSSTVTQKMNFFYSNPEKLYAKTLPFSHRMKNPTTSELNHELKLHNSKDDAFRFEMVLIEEHLEESLVVLADRLCWSFKEMLYFRTDILNKRLDRNEIILNQEIQGNIYDWNSLDVKYYNNRKNFLLETINSNSKLQKDLTNFRSLLKLLDEHCKVDPEIYRVNFGFKSKRNDNLSIVDGKNQPVKFSHDICERYFKYSHDTRTLDSKRRTIPLKLRFDPRTSEIYKLDKITKFLRTGHWVNDEVYLPGGCTRQKIYTKAEIKEKMEAKQLAVIGDGRTQFLFQLLQKLGLPSNRVFSHRYWNEILLVLLQTFFVGLVIDLNYTNVEYLAPPYRPPTR